MTTTHNGRDSAGLDILEQLASRIDQAAAAVDKLDHQARDSAHELQHAIEAFHKEALTRMVRRLKDDPRGKELLFEMVDDPLIYALFVRHAIVRPNIIMRVSRVLDLARPYIRSHGGDVELVEVRDNVVYVRLHGSCNGCSLSAVTLRNEIEAALRTNIPEITGVQVVAAEAAPALIMPESIGVRDHLAGWVAGPPTDDVPPGVMYRLQTERDDILIINLDGRLSAFRNACAHQGLPLDGGILDAETGTITCPWHGFCYDASSGECLTAPQAQLEPFPLRIEQGRIWVRPTGE
ncbi:NifU family protein [Roseiflexus sp.]|jgi:nitrite reductase/ring-hydroxylating ferredoxin subunit/Fe-S cluster biogenesis protein NfuA